MNLTADENFEVALEQAKEKDKIFKDLKAAGKLKDLTYLHGIPFSVKDTFALKGCKFSSGTDTHLLEDY